MQYFKNIIIQSFLLLPLITAHSAEIEMSFANNIPPYTFTNTHQGIELEIIGAALQYKGHHLKPSYYSLKDVPLAFKEKRVHAAMTDLGEDLSIKEGYYGDPAVLYDNVFITLKESNISIKKPEDLNGLLITSFQGAVKRYPQWLQPIKAQYNYFEQKNQELQVLLLHKKRVDVILSDINIYKYNVITLEKNKGFVSKAVDIHHFVTLNKNDYRPIFRDKKIRNDFNEGLEYIKKTGEYQRIYDKYLKVVE